MPPRQHPWPVCVISHPSRPQGNLRALSWFDPTTVQSLLWADIWERDPRKSLLYGRKKGKDLGSREKFSIRGFKRNSLVTLSRIPNGRCWSPRSTYLRQEGCLSPCYLCRKDPEEGLMMCHPLVCSNETGSFLINQIPRKWVPLTCLERFPFLSNKMNTFPWLHAWFQCACTEHFTTPLDEWGRY